MQLCKEQRNIQILMHKVDNTGCCHSLRYMCDMIALRLLKVLQCVLYYKRERGPEKELLCGITS